MALKSVRIDIIPHEEQRYDTVGDWIDSGDELVITVSDLNDDKENLAVAIHELIEAVLCIEAGVTQESVDAFDIDYEANRVAGDDSEPGDDPAAPYYNQHQSATSVERSVVAEFGLDWEAYDQHVKDL